MRRRLTALLLATALPIALTVAVAGYAATPAAVSTDTSATEPLFEGIGPNGRKISTSSPLAQKYFDQGLSFLYGFNHDEAIRSFAKATELDPRAAMAWWGIALANGPNINNPVMSEEAATAAWNALQHARKEGSAADATERGLIDALATRYAASPPKDRSALDLAYAQAMRAVWQRHPDDADVGALFAEAMLDLRPWDQWTPEGKAQPGTEEVLATLETVRKLRPDHWLALHLYIHAVEASHDPGGAETAADRLRALPTGLGHLIHMPSHIDVRLGHWDEAITANAKGIAADDRYRAISPQQGFYGLYMAHNHHMLAFAAMMIGRKQEAIDAIDSMTNVIPPQWARQFAPIADGFLAMPLEVRMRFGAWDEILAAPDLEPIFPLARAMRHYARGVAYSAKHDTESARREQKAFLAAGAALPADSQFGNNKGADVLAIADRVLEGEVSYREGKREAAFQALRQAVELEDQLRYDEPPSWILPARHTLGAALLDAGQPGDAEKVFREDLVRRPANGWSLFGLARSLRMQNQDAQAAEVEAQFKKAWAGADFQIDSPCACLPGT